MKNRFNLFIVFIFFYFPLFAKEVVIVGNIIGAGSYIETDDNTYPFKHTELQKELSELTGKKVRMLCLFEEDSCVPLRYEIAPFANDKNLAKWTIKKIPKYVYRGLIAFNPSVTPDGNILFWTVLTPEGHGSNTQKIWYSEMDTHGFWKKGVQMDPPLNNKAPAAIISALPGGNELFVFGSHADQESFEEIKRQMDAEKAEIVKTSKSAREVEGRYAAVRERYRREMEKIQNKVPLYKSFKQGNGWSVPQRIPFPDFYNLYRSEDNANLQIFGGSTLSSSGKTLIYSAKHKDSVGKLDLYVSNITDGVFPIGTNLGKEINTEYEEMAPFLASDDRTLYFSSNGHSGLSIYFTQRVGDSWTEWSHPQEISKNLKGVNFFSIPASGNWAYASREGQLLMTYLPNETKPNPVIIVKGRITNDKGVPLGAEVYYESLTTKENKGSTISDPNTGKFSIVLPYGDNYGFHAKKEGYLPFHRSKDLRESEKLYQEVEVDMILPKIEKGGEITINNLFFESNRSEIKKESEPELDRLGEIMKMNKNLEVALEGHTDNVGKSADNIALSLARANAVAEYIVKKFGIEPSRLKVEGRGEEAPLTDNNTADGRAKNRRVVFRILKN
ncbi:MAG TPA: OmpA family protein [Leptospiraceae bacterium]|nr:OmpA family protein [Leptospiraceae bacterium]HMW05765.1 OmpA family protein [Leptospiraceae bacterium]HMX33851.1 OmpA family protein [Leptospiraceae bacterium]HMY33360.1 OmpA family protein [Leptospiraceae bacterium]HMZ65433.1 OmpA family protein [Leptospiraceae bacterium]